VYVKKHIKRDRMEVEEEIKAHPSKSKLKVPHRGQKLVKVYVPKEVMMIETTKAQVKTPLRRARKKVEKKKHQGTPLELARRNKRMKKNIPKKPLDASELKAPSPIKNLIQPSKVTLITEFFEIIGKRTSSIKPKLAPDPT